MVTRLIAPPPLLAVERSRAAWRVVACRPISHRRLVPRVALTTSGESSWVFKPTLHSLRRHCIPARPIPSRPDRTGRATPSYTAAARPSTIYNVGSIRQRRVTARLQYSCMRRRCAADVLHLQADLVAERHRRSGDPIGVR